MSDIEIPILRNDGDTLQERMTENAYENILPARYMQGDAEGNFVETQEEVFDRVAKNIAVAEAVYSDDPLKQVDVSCLHDHFDEEDVGYTFEFGTIPLNEETAKFFSYNKLLDEFKQYPEEYEDTIVRMEKGRRKFRNVMEKLGFIPNTPTIINAGTEHQQLSACFVLSPGDDMEDIHEKAKEAAMIFQSGGGCGYDFSKLRPYGDSVGSNGGVASGPITFMETFDQVCETVAQGGVRRGAQMATMRIDHPDVIEFIHSKRKDVSLAHTLRLNDPDDPKYTKFGEAIEEARDLIDDEGRVPEHLRNAVEGHLSNFNISVTVTDEFMEAKENGEDYTLINPRTEEPHIVTEETVEVYSWFGLDEYLEVGEEMTLPAEELWTRIVEGAYENGEPGVIYIDEVNKEHSYDTYDNPEYVHNSTNPCAEQPLMQYEACNLGHINLSTLVEEDRELLNEWLRAEYGEELENISQMELELAIEDYIFEVLDMEEFDDRIEIGTQFLDNVVTMSNFPVDAIEETVRENRKIGLGIMGLAQLYIQLGIEYGSERANIFAEKLMKYINHQSKAVSSTLAARRGSFENWKDSKYANPTDYPEWFEKHVGDDPDYYEGGMEMRNHNTTTIAPTGTTSMLGNTTGGCEPIYNVAYYKNVTDDIQGDEMLVEFDELFLRVLEENDIDVDQAKKEAQELMENNEFDGASSIPSVPEEIGNLFVTTSDLSAEEHASVQCALQKGVDSSISKTVNAPNDATLEDAKDAFDRIYEGDGKSVTYYRDGTRTKQVLTTRKDNQETEEEEEEASNPTPEPRERPKVTTGQTHQIQTGYGSLYVIINEDEEGPIEIFATVGKSGGTMESFTEALARQVSLNFRAGISVDEVIDQLSDIRSPRHSWDEGDDVESIPDGIALALKRYKDSSMKHPTAKPTNLEEKSDVQTDELDASGNGGYEPCPQCGSELKIIEGCETCSNDTCGWSGC